MPLTVCDCCFPKHSLDEGPLPSLVIRVYPYKLWLCCSVPCKGRDPTVASRIERFIKESELTHFTHRSDRDPAIVAMLEEACSDTGRNGVRETSKADSESEEASHEQLVDDGHPDGAVLAHEHSVDDAPHVPSSCAVDSTHTAAPELTHPCESQSNGLAERSVGVSEDQFRTLKHALELRPKQRLPSSHPVTSWLVEHTAWVFNNFQLGSDG